MFGIRRSIRRTLSCGVFALGILALGTSAAHAVEMSTFPDILSGERQVLNMDDILVAQTFANPNDPYVARDVELGLTSNMAIIQVVGKKLDHNRLATTGSTPRPELIATGRIFRSSTDFAITFTVSDYDDGAPRAPQLQTTLLRKAATALEELGTEAIAMAALQPRALAVADFTGDGFADVAFYAAASDTAGGIVIGTAADVEDPQKLFGFGPENVVPACLDMKAADLDGDGVPEIVCLHRDGSGTNLSVSVYSVNPVSLELTALPGNEYVVASWNAADKIRLALGKFDGDIRDAEIVVVQGRGDSVYVRPIKVRIAPTAVTFEPAPVRDIGPYLPSPMLLSNRLTALEVATGKLDWFGGNPRDQLVIGVGLYADLLNSGYAAAVVSFFTDTVSAMSMNSGQIKASVVNASSPHACLAGVAVGRFSPPSPDANGIPTNSQVALLLANAATTINTTCSGPDAWGTFHYTGMSVDIYSVDVASGYKLARSSAKGLPIGGAEGGISSTPPRLAVGDFQGRSLLLGRPSIITVAQQSQPQFVIGAPPMHLDYFTPPRADTRPECYASKERYEEPDSRPYTPQAVSTATGCIQNVSAYPGIADGANGAICEFCAKFATSDEKSASGEQKSTTSHTWSNEGGGAITLTFGNMKPGVFGGGGLQTELHGSAKMMRGTVDSTVGSVLSRQSLSITTLTDTDDLVWYTSQDLYIYLYPVIGRTDADGKPVYLEFSIPDKTQYLHDKARNLPWFQPPHEIGNIFSYPGNDKQLLADYPGTKLQSGPFNWTSSVADTTIVSWTEAQDQTKTAGSVDRLDWNLGTSVTGIVGASKIFTAKANAYYDHNESTAHEYTNTNRKSLSQSLGFTVTSQSFEKILGTVYDMTGFILGSPALTVTDGYWDEAVPVPDPKGAPGDFAPDFRLAGPMQLAYTTDMATKAGSNTGYVWGAVYGTKPDIALQHPRRFKWMQRDSTVAQSDVWQFIPLYTDYTLSTVYQSEFLNMKGFFITSGNAATPNGPQMTMAAEGTRLRLSARVFNYSLANLPDGATVKARFYAHQLDPDGQFAQVWVPGACTLIGEGSVSIGGFSAVADHPTNRAMVSTTFDTTDRGGQRLIFWVVAWAENADGTLVPEVEQHGLTQKPPVDCPANSILGMPMEFYSNNVGFYEQEFYVMPKVVAAGTRRAAGPVQPFSIGTLTASSIDRQRPYAGQQWELVADLRAGSEDAYSVQLVHEGSGPGGHLTLTSSVPHIEAGQTYVDRVPFRPLWCGPHSATVTARAAFHDPVTAPLDFDIPCRPEDVTAFMNDVITDGSLAGLIPVNNNGQVLGKLAPVQTAVLAAEKLARKGAVAGACEQYAHAIGRIAALYSGPTAQLFEKLIINARGRLGCR